MAMFTFKKDSTPQRGNRMGKSIALAGCNTLGGGMGSPGGSMFGGGIYSPGTNRFNAVYDRLEDPSLVDEWMSRDIRQINKMFRYLYLRDAIAGPTVDMMSTIPWSDYHLAGLEGEKEVASVYEESMENFDPVEMMPQISCEYLVIGRICLSCIYNSERRVFEYFIPQDPDWLEITPIPIKGFEPKIDVISDQNMRRFITSKDERDQRALQVIPDGLLRQLIKGGKIPLEPLNTIFAPRTTFTSDWVGTSIYTRILPFWAVEKALLNSTIVSARRRTRPIMHITAGIDDKWEPEDYELDDITMLFMQADEDPSGAIVVTRNGIEVQEVKDPASQWKISDEYDYLVRGKLNALGINEELLSGNMTFNNLDTALSFFMEKIKNFRTGITNQVFHKKMFPVLAQANGFYKRSSASPQVWTSRKRLLIPEVKWHKDLKPKGDAEYLAMLRDLKEMGLPIGMAVLAAAGDMDIEKLISDSERDLEYRRKLKKYKDELKELEGGNDMGGEGGFGMAEFMGDMKLWDAKGTFLGVTKKDIKQVIADFAKCRNLQAITSDVHEIEKRLASHFDNDPMKIHACKYLLARWGLFDKKVVRSDAFTTNMIQHIIEANNQGGKFDGKSFSEELHALNEFITDRPKLSKSKAQKLAMLITKLHNKETVKSSDLDFFGGLQRKTLLK